MAQQVDHGERPDLDLSSSPPARGKLILLIAASLLVIGAAIALLVVLAQPPAAPTQTVVVEQPVAPKRAVEREINIEVSDWDKAPQTEALAGDADTDSAPVVEPPKPSPPPKDERRRSARRDRERRRASEPRSSPGKRTEKAADREPGLLYIGATPSARVYLDGALQGFTPQNALAVAPGPHELTLEANGMRTHRTRLVVLAGQKRIVEVRLEPIAEPAPASEPPPAKPAVVAAKPAPPPPKPAPAEPQPTLPVPRLRLPAKVEVNLYVAGELSKVPRVVCVAVERTVTKAMGRSAAGTTRAMLDAIYGEHAEASSTARATLYPRVMGYLIAEALGNNKGGIASMLAKAHRSGRLASLTASGWRP